MSKLDDHDVQWRAHEVKGEMTDEERGLLHATKCVVQELQARVEALEALEAARSSVASMEYVEEVSPGPKIWYSVGDISQAMWPTADFAEGSLR